MLLSVALQLTPYDAPIAPPRIAYRSHSWLAARGCGGRPCTIQGLYLDGNVIYLDRELQPLNTPEAQSVLLHELVHYLQHKSGQFPSECEARVQREREAYVAQARFLITRGVLAGVAYAPGPCPSDDTALTSTGSSSKGSTPD
ncbi:MAG: ImmA/IrrE family metallo-endopeptidase [Pseudomonadota bacterium]